MHNLNANWTAEITNNPDADFSLYIELLEGDRHQGRIFRAHDGQLVLAFYGSAEVPLDWLLRIAEGAKHDL